MRMGRNSKIMWSTLSDAYADILRLRADDLGFGNKDLGDLIGQPRDLMSRFFSKQFFSAELLKKICQVLDYPITNLMTPEGKERYLHATRNSTGQPGMAGATQEKDRSE